MVKASVCYDYSISLCENQINEIMSSCVEASDALLRAMRMGFTVIN